MNLKHVLLGKPAEELLEVRFLRNCRVNDRDWAVDDIAKFDRKTAGSLLRDESAERTSPSTAAKDDGVKLPEPSKPNQLPESWKDLPECFKDWHAVSERFRCARLRVAELETLYLKECGLDGGDRRYALENLDRSVTNNAQRAELLDRVVTGLIGSIRLGIDEATRRSKVRDALTRAHQLVDDLRESEHENLWKLHLQCGDQVIAAHGELTKLSRELSAEGNRRFRDRIAPLGLGEDDIRRLYKGSADAMQFEIEIPRLLDQRVGWVDDLGTRTYWDRSPMIGAGILIGFREEIARCKAILRKATKAKKAA